METSGNDIIIPLENVDSEHCALIVGKGIAKIRGVTSSRVELNNKQAIIRAGNPQTVAETVTTIRDLGYDVSTVKKTYPVLEMTCASCAVSVESILKAQWGVVDARVNFASASVVIEFIPGVTNEEALQHAVRSIGYDILTGPGPEAGLSAETIQKNNFNRLKKKTYWSLVLSVPVVIIGMFFSDWKYSNVWMWIISTPVMVWPGRSFFINSWKQARHRSANMDTLVALSTGVAYLFSVFNTLFPGFWLDRGLETHVYFEAAVVIISFILLGKLLEEKAKGNTSSAIKKLMNLQPDVVTLVDKEGGQLQVPVDRVLTGNIIQVKPGERIAVDGTVVQGNSYVDESMLSGEPVPVLKKEQEKVFAGTINMKGSFQFRADKIGSETRLARIIKMVRDAQGSKAPVQKLVDRVSGIFVPVVIVIAVIAGLAWYVLDGENGFSQGLLAFITVLVIACPCALGLATPTAIMVGVGKGAEKGILIKDAESLELAKNVNAIILDKTGTITEGKPVVTNEIWINANPDLKKILYNIEKLSEHPLAEAIVDHLKDQEHIAVSDFESITGKGVKATLNDEIYLAGSKRFILENSIQPDPVLSATGDSWSSEAKTQIWFAGAGKLLAVLAITDPVKLSSKEAISVLQRSGIEVYMLTGDSESTAKIIAKETGIEHYTPEVLPEGKADFVSLLQKQGKIVAMAGDGINDSTALARAEVSIAMGKGSDIAMDVAKMTIISSDLMKIPEAIRLSGATVKTIKQNLFWAFIYNLIGIPVAAGILYPVNGFLLNPMIAGAAMALSSVSVVSNSLRLKWTK